MKTRQHLQASKLALAIILSSAATAETASINVSLLDTYATGLFNSSASEITAYSPVSQRFFVTSSATGKLDVLALDASNNVSKVSDIALPGGGPNSVAVSGNVVAVAVQAAVKGVRAL
jgi:hypothetical protein